MSQSRDVGEMRQAVRGLNQELRVFNTVAATSNLSGQDLLALFRALGLGPEVSRAIMTLQTAIAVANTARVTLKMLQIELGPVGWAILGITTVGGIVAAETGVLDSLGR